jgi:hypothetical protein
VFDLLYLSLWLCAAQLGWLTWKLLHSKLLAREPYVLNSSYIILSSCVFMIHRVHSLYKPVYVPFIHFCDYIWVATCGIVSYVWLFPKESAPLVAMLYMILASSEMPPILILFFHLCLSSELPFSNIFTCQNSTYMDVLMVAYIV